MIKPKPQHLYDPINLIALGFGSGLAKRMPGTVGSAVALLLYAAFLSGLSFYSYIIFLLVSFLVGVIACDYSGKVLGDKDHKAIVCDEFVGMWIALISVHHIDISNNTIGWLLLAFVLFRLFDIVKIPPVKKMESLPGGFGAMLDDVVAGFIAAALIIVIQFFFVLNLL